MFFNFKSSGFLSAVLVMIASSVALGAFGSHGLRPLLTPRKFEIYQTACQYLSIHSLGLLLLLILNNTTFYTLTPKTIYSLFFGVLIFCSSLLLVSMSELYAQPGLNKFGMTAPIGGTLLILGYLFAVFDILKSKKG